MWNQKFVPNSPSNPENEDKIEGITFPDFKLHYNAVLTNNSMVIGAIKITAQRLKEQSKEDRTKSTYYDQLIFHRRAKST